MKEIKFRDLRAEELEVRIGNVLKDSETNKPYAFQVMIYKTARADQQVLDETLGVFGWKNNYYQVKNTMVCSISLWDDEKKQWINKDNGGDDDFNTEQVKAELSDSMKRAGFNVGIGRKLYTLNKLYMVINIDNENTTKSRFAVNCIEYDDVGVTHIEIINTRTKKVALDSSRKDIGKINKSTYNEPKTTKESHSNFDNKSSVSMKELNASVNSMEYNDPFSDSEDRKYVKEYYETLSVEGKQRFEVWLFTYVKETKIERLNEEQVSAVAQAIKNKVAKELEKKAGNQ